MKRLTRADRKRIRQYVNAKRAVEIRARVQQTDKRDLHALNYSKPAEQLVPATKQIGLF